MNLDAHALKPGLLGAAAGGQPANASVAPPGRRRAWHEPFSRTRRYAGRRRRSPWALRRAERRTLIECFMLAALLHILLIVVFGNAPAGSARPGRGVAGSLNVTLRGYDRPSGPVVDVPATPAPGPAGTAPRERWGGVVRKPEPAPRSDSQPGAAKLGRWAPAAPPTEQAPIAPITSAPPDDARLPSAAPPTLTALPTPAIPTPEAPAPTERAEVAPAPPAPVAVPAERIVPPTAAPAIPAEPPAEPAPVPLIARPLPDTPKIEPLSIPAPIEVPPVTLRPVEVKPPEPKPVEPIPVQPAPAPAPEPVVAAPPAANITPPQPAPRASAASAAGALQQPIPGAPDAGPRQGHDVATPPSAAASAPPPLNLQLSRPHGGELSGRMAPGALPLLPRPPERPSKLATDIQNAAKRDCRTAYAGMGLLGAVPLAANAATGSGCKW